MNVILFRPNEPTVRLPLADARARHILRVLRFGVGDTLDVGLVNGPMGKATIVDVSEAGVDLECRFATEVTRLHAVELVIGLPRPPSCRRILRDLTALGARQLHFVATDKGEASYRNSRLWADGEYERLLLEGAQQAFQTGVPEVSLHDSLAACLDRIEPDADRLGLDNYEATGSLSDYRPRASHCTLAVGSERGWSGAERDLLRGAGFALLSLGSRVLKTETACIAGLAVVLEKRGALAAG